MIQKPTFREALRFWVKLGFISFGGPAGQVAIMHEFLVDKKKWISDSKFLHALNYCMILPGPEAQQLATYIGWMLHGTLGGLAAGILFVLPSMFILLGLSAVYVSFGHVPLVYALFGGLKPAVIAIVLLALLKIGKKSLLSPFHYLVAAAAFVCIFFLHLPFPLIIVGAIVTAAVTRRFFPFLFETGNRKEAARDLDESGYFINKHTKVEGVGFNPRRFWKQAGTGVLLWTASLALFYFFTSDFVFWKQLAFFFTQAALVTFGGAYAVLPYVAQVSVEQFHWLSNLQMIDGLALGETTPGPLIMILVFVGFMAGYNRFDQSIVMGSLGLVATTFYTFLPCFLFIFMGAPLIERTQENKTVKQILSLVTAAVVGVVLNLSIYLGKAVLFPKEFSAAGLDLLSLIWVLLSFVAMYRFKVGMISWIVVSALFGMIRYLLEQGL
ncbi:MAG: chromate efflux transporter [Chitinophagaceae bacterium]|nr:chromate efflux transporter [Chitinophagaceae bacterium]